MKIKYVIATLGVLLLKFVCIRVMSVIFGSYIEVGRPSKSDILYRTKGVTRHQQEGWCRSG